MAACASWLPERLRHWSDTHEIREAGLSYTLSQVAVPGVFHPKLVLAASESQGIALVGSGNVSEYGMATGGELFTAVDWHGDDVPSMAQEAWQLCREIARRLPVDRTFSERVESMGRLVPTLGEAADDRILLHNLDEPILEQFIRALPDDRVTELLAWSPFTDHRLGALEGLVERLAPSRVTIAVQPGLTKLDGARLKALAERFGETSWETREIHRASTEASPGMIHAKGLVVTLETGEELALTGSPNLSTPALARTAAEANLEIGVIHRAADLREWLFGADSPIVLGDEVDPDGLTWEEDPTTSERHPAVPAVSLLGARRDGERLHLEMVGEPPPRTALLLDGADRVDLTRSPDGSWLAALSAGDVSRTAELDWGDGRSGPVVITDVRRLSAMRRGPDTRPPATLSALDYGADSDILALLEELAGVAIVSVHDIERLLQGRGAPTAAVEAAEADGTAEVVTLGEIDFGAIRQHPRAYGYGGGRAGGLETPRIVLWLDEVVAQFEALQEHQLRLVTTPDPNDEDEDESAPSDVTAEPRRWAVSKRVAVLVRNRLRRGVDGMADPRFRALVDADWMAMNHALWLTLIDRVWVRASSPQPILEEDDVATLAADLLSGYWGDDRRAGYIAQLDAEARGKADATLTARHGDALLAATAIRLLETRGTVARRAPFVVAAYVRAAEPAGLLSEQVVERALVLLDRVDEPAGPLLDQLLATKDRFSWERFADNLAWRYGLSSAAVMNEIPGVGAFASGRVLVIGKSSDIPVGPATMSVFAAWAGAIRDREPERDVIQMAWGRGVVAIYDAKYGQLMVRRVERGKLGDAQLVGTDVTVDDLATIEIDDHQARQTA